MGKCLEQICSTIEEELCCLECEMLPFCDFPCEYVELGLIDKAECELYVNVMNAIQLKLNELLEGGKDNDKPK